MKIVKKNQLIMVLLAVMVFTAGYLSYVYNNDIKDTYGQEITGTVANDYGKAEFVTSNKAEASSQTGTDTLSQQQVDNINYFIQAKIDRDKVFDEQVDMQEKIMENDKIVKDNKDRAQQQINKLSDIMTKQMVVESLIRAKGFQDVLVLINNPNTSVVIRADKELNIEQVAQIQNIVNREAGIEIRNIHIMRK